MTLLFLESIGTTELLVILVVALVVFGPRRLPDIGRKIGKGMSDFRRASDDFKRTWEREVELERTTTESATLPATPAVGAPAETGDAAGPVVFESENSVARGPRGAAAGAGPQPAAEEGAARHESLGKSDWL